MCDTKLKPNLKNERKCLETKVIFAFDGIKKNAYSSFNQVYSPQIAFFWTKSEKMYFFPTQAKTWK